MSHMIDAQMHLDIFFSHFAFDFHGPSIIDENVEFLVFLKRWKKE